ncbi:hypothetical protein [Tessaracoccus coleopterorum]|uniref:hypothetical protein n=1 Tax=Tessaracoccus coleopterorum TaxID=2714950 RepID=UPI0018D3E29D|nr:hypothetical protein [Tessaracoccus coleopterorum]
MRVIQAATLIGAAGSILLVARRLSFEASTTISLLIVVLQMAWMIWLCRAWRRDRTVPPIVHRSGTGIAVGSRSTAATSTARATSSESPSS